MIMEYQGADGPVVRMPVPPLEHRPPACPLCDGDTEFQEGWDCPRCQVSWPESVSGVQFGTFEYWEPVPEQCPEEILPFADSKHESIRGNRYRCVRDVGHVRVKPELGISTWHVGIRVDGDAPDPEQTYHWSS